MYGGERGIILELSIGLELLTTLSFLNILINFLHAGHVDQRTEPFYNSLYKEPDLSIIFIILLFNGSSIIRIMFLNGDTSVFAFSCLWR